MRPASRPAVAALALAASAVGPVGCAGTGGPLALAEVKPWQRGALAHEDMQLVTDPLDELVDDHVYFSREASTGGSGARGGGCGCN